MCELLPFCCHIFPSTMEPSKAGRGGTTGTKDEYGVYKRPSNPCEKQGAQILHQSLKKRPNTPAGKAHEKAQAWAIIQICPKSPTCWGHTDSHTSIGFIKPYKSYEVDESSYVVVANREGPLYLTSI